jgi:hypothetical protein
VIVETDRNSGATTATERHLAAQPLSVFEEFDLFAVRSVQSFDPDYRELGAEEQHCCFVRGYN